MLSIFIYLPSIHMFSVEVSSQIFAYFPLGCFHHFLLSFKKIYFRSKSLIRYMICKYFFPVCDLFFILTLSFREQKSLILKRTDFTNFLHYGSCLESYLRNLCLIQGHKDFLIFFSRSFIVLGFTIRDMIPL